MVARPVTGITSKFADGADYISFTNDNIIKNAEQCNIITTRHGIIASDTNRREQVAQLSQRDRAAGWVSYGQKWKTRTGRQYFKDIGLPSTIVT